LIRIKISIAIVIAIVFFRAGFVRNRDPKIQVSGSAPFVPEVPHFGQIFRDQICIYFGLRYRKRAPFDLKKIYSAKDVNKPVPW
jgi:hypothetical protein